MINIIIPIERSKPKMLMTDKVQMGTSKSEEIE